MEQRFWRIKTAVAGGMIGVGILLLVLAGVALGLGIFFSVKTQVQHMSPMAEMSAGKTFKQKLKTLPAENTPYSIVFENTVAKEVEKVPNDVRKSTFINGEPLKFSIDLTGGRKTEEGQPYNPAAMTTYTLDRPHLERSGKESQWRLSDDDTAKFDKFYVEFAEKQPPDPVEEQNTDRAGDSYHYVWVCGIWGVILLALGIVLKRFDPDKY